MLFNLARVQEGLCRRKNTAELALGGVLKERLVSCY